MEINFLDDCNEAQVNNVVRVTHITVAAVMDGKLLFVKKRGKSTMELPSINSEKGEKPADAVARLLSDNLNITDRSVEFISAYDITDGNNVEYGILYYADVTSMKTLNDHELCASYFLAAPPEDISRWTYPETDRKLIDKAMEHVKSKK